MLDALKDYIFITKEAKYLPKYGRREEWHDTVGRVIDQHFDFYEADDNPALGDAITEAFNDVYELRVLPSHRALQYGGDPILRNHCRQYNCWGSYCDRPRFFAEAFFLLLSGGGTGFSVQKHHVAKLPPVSPCNSGMVTWVVEDSIEGWAESLNALVGSYLRSFPTVCFDYSNIRPKGSPIGSGGKAPGYEPLERSLEAIRKVFESRVGQRLRPIDCYDIVMHASEAVLAGGVRRSATLCVFSPDDDKMMHAKTGDWYRENPQRERSNNSALLLRGKTDRETFHKLMLAARYSGDPGMIWTDDTEVIFNPCVESSFYCYDDQGRTGWQACNLTEINGAMCKTPRDFWRACESAAVIGTLQAGYTNFGYLGEVSERITRREALLGVSITGFCDNPDVLFNPVNLEVGAQVVKDTNERIAKMLGINPAARTTLVKPSGTTSCRLGTASGIHPHHAKRYFRRATANNMEAPVQLLQSVNPDMVEPMNKETDSSVIFCVEAPFGAKTKKTLPVADLMQRIALVQKHWVEKGTRHEALAQPFLRHNVSNTLALDGDAEWDLAEAYIFENQGSFAGVSVFPASGELDYKQPPMCEVLTAEEIVSKYGEGSMLASGLIVDGIRAFGDLWDATDALLYQRRVKGEFQVDWIERAKRFAVNFFGGDVKLMTYCLKDVNNLHKWNRIQHNYKPVDWSMLRESEDNTTHGTDVACAGGACEILS